MISIKRLMAVAMVSFSFLGFSQAYLGIHHSNYAGVMGTDWNPASFVDGRFKVDINLGSANFNAYTNAGYLDTKDMPKWWTKSFKADKGTNANGTPEQTFYVNGGSNPYNDWAIAPGDSSQTLDPYIIRNYDETTTKTLGIYNNVQVDVLNFMFHIKPTIAVGFTAKFREVTNVDDIDPVFATLLEKDFLKDSTEAVNYASSLWNNNFEEGLLNMNHMSWAEYGVIYSQVLFDEGQHFLKMGAKAKWLSGYTAAYIHTDNFSYTVQNDSTFSSVSGDFAYGHSAHLDDKLNAFGNGEDSGGNATFNSLGNQNGGGLGAFLGKATGGAVSKFGLGLDIGFVYEWRPDWKEFKYDMDGKTDIWRQDKEKYKLRVGLAVTDIGGMKFEKGKFNQDFTINNNTGFDFRNTFDIYDGTLDENGNELGGLTAIDKSIDSLITNDPTVTSNGDDDGTFFMSTPTAININVDYNIWKWFYLDVSGQISIQNRKNPHRVRVANQVSFTPSFDYAWAGVGIPLSYNKYSGFKAGLGMRLGPLTVGVTDFKTLFAAGKVNGAEFYAGLRLPILYSHPSDIDGDLVSDKLDECLVVQGLWEFRGCPDTDRDGIKDIDDHCPNDPGIPEFNGCPDTDGDSIPDKDDACPEDFGPKKYQGCPDRDNDSIIDNKDDCPDVPGLAKFNGCPDTDGDGIKDEDDACPDVPGPLVNNGCPDTDGDGLFDFIDECPTEFGPKENNGCPWPDTDGDGLLDKDDKCPYLAGPLANEGCPYQDTDEDGVLDKDDKCPNTPGPVSNQGCPEIEVEVQEILKTAFDNLEFETGKDIIKLESLPSLGELADVLVKKPEWKLQISGHTDNVGNDQNNLVLSKKRAESVKAFMVSKGVATDRLSTLYFGETLPIADNATPEGRQKNRRVEMVIIFE